MIKNILISLLVCTSTLAEDAVPKAMVEMVNRMIQARSKAQLPVSFDKEPLPHVNYKVPQCQIKEKGAMIENCRPITCWEEKPLMGRSHVVEFVIGGYDQNQYCKYSNPTKKLSGPQNGVS
jgi:hypothetical protein